MLVRQLRKPKRETSEGLVRVQRDESPPARMVHLVLRKTLLDLWVGHDESRILFDL